MRDDQIDLCGRVDFLRDEGMPLLGRKARFSFACAGCGDCWEDIVLSGYDLWRIAQRLDLPPKIVARGYCRSSIGPVSGLPVLRLAPVKEQRNNCPFLDGGRCAIHDAEPLVCALYPLAQEISREGETAYFLQPTQCGGQRVEARVEDYLALYGTLEREPLDVRWAMACMDLEDRVWTWRPYCGAGCRINCGRRYTLATTRTAPGRNSWKRIFCGWRGSLTSWLPIRSGLLSKKQMDKID